MGLFCIGNRKRYRCGIEIHILDLFTTEKCVTFAGDLQNAN